MAEQDLEQEQGTELVVLDSNTSIDLGPQWGNRQEIDIMAKRVIHMMPGAKDFTMPEARLVAQYALITGLNPFGGDFYAWVNRPDDPKRRSLAIKPHYRLIVRWAQGISRMHIRYTPAEDVPAGAIGVLCHLVRQDALASSAHLVQAFGSDVAKEYLEVIGFGMLLSNEMSGRPAPKGQQWQQTAEKRALEHAIKRAYGYPTTAELARLSWIVNGQQTSLQDYLDMPQADQLGAGASASAALTAEYRQLTEHREQAGTQGVGAQQALNELFDGAGDAWAAKLAAQTEPEPEPEPLDPEHTPRPWGAELVRAFVESQLPHASVTNATEPLTQKQQSLLCAKLEQVFGGEGQEADKRVHVLQYLWGVDSSSKMTRGQSWATLKWVLTGKKDDTGDWILHQHAASEAHAVEQAWQVAQGQLELPVGV